MQWRLSQERLSQEPDDLPFHFMICIMKQNSQFIPLLFLDKSELLELNGIDLPSQLSSLESYELKSKLTHIPSLQDFDMDENLIHKVNSKYYDIIDFTMVNKNPTIPYQCFILIVGVCLLMLKNCNYF